MSKNAKVIASSYSWSEALADVKELTLLSLTHNDYKGQAWILVHDGSETKLIRRTAKARKLYWKKHGPWLWSSDHPDEAPTHQPWLSLLKLLKQRLQRACAELALRSLIGSEPEPPFFVLASPARSAIVIIPPRGLGERWLSRRRSQRA